MNGQRTTALLDSAAEMTILDDDFAARLGLVPDRQRDRARLGRGDDARPASPSMSLIEALGGSMAMRVGILDLGEVSQRLIGRNVDLLLGRELFDRAGSGSTLPAARSRRSTASRAACACRSASIAASRPSPPRSRAMSRSQAVFDLGNGSDVLIGRAYAERIGLTAPGPDRRAASRRRPRRRAASATSSCCARFDPRRARPSATCRAAIDPGETASDLNIGTSILRHFLIATDFAGRAIWLEPRE